MSEKAIKETAARQKQRGVPTTMLQNQRIESLIPNKVHSESIQKRKRTHRGWQFLEY